MLSQKKYNILVTGGAGFLGKAIIRELLDPASPATLLSSPHSFFIKVIDQFSTGHI